MKKEILSKYGKYAVTFAVLLVMAYLFPYTGDDLVWGSAKGLARLEGWFVNYNGRYLGNLLVLLLTRSNLLKTVSIAFVVTGILYLLERLVHKSGFSYGFFCLAVLCIPRVLVIQTIEWTSGFTNYVVSLFFTLIYFSYIWDIVEERRVTVQKYKHIPWLLLLGIANTMIMEHLTIYHLCLSAAVVVYLLVKTKKIWVQHMAYFVGTVTGTAVMFRNSAYHRVIQGVDRYRTINQDNILYKAAKTYVKVIYNEVLLQNVALNVFLGVICILLTWKCIENLKGMKYAKWMKICTGIIASYGAYGLISLGLSGTQKTLLLMEMESIFTAAAGLAIFVYTLIIGKIFGCVLKFLFLTGSVAVVTAPLLFVKPLNSRCFFASYIFLVLLAGSLLQILIRFLDQAFLLQCKKMLYTMCGIGTAFYFVIFGSNYKTARDRLAAIRTECEKGADTVTITKLPYEQYTWRGTPILGTFHEEFYKEFYGLPKDLKMVVEEYNKKTRHSRK